MEAIVRKPFQGVINIIRFNWHFYLIAGFIIAFLFTSSALIPNELSNIVYVIIILILVALFLSLAISFYVYDYSGLYKFKWLDNLSVHSKSKIANIHAGFDETSLTFRHRYPQADLTVFDFYDPKKHTEVSIERARKAYEPYLDTKPINTDFIPLTANSTDLSFNIFSLHEIRNREERINFLKRQHTYLKDDGRCIIVEHLRDLPNFIAYNIGFFHFLSEHEWKNNFLMAGFEIENVIKVTPFVSVFILKKSNEYTS
jgi:hypothetical protein